MRNNSINILVKPTHECNMHCNYCYDKAEKKLLKNKFMSIDLIEEIIIKACRSYENINWIWHGGEPTLIGRDFFEKSIKLINDIAKKYNSNIRYNMQTNGEILSKDKEFYNSLKKLKVMISVSLDVTSKNLNRNKNNFNDIYKFVTENKLPIINVITEEDFNNLKETYIELSDKNINFSFNKIFNKKFSECELNKIIDNYKKYIDYIFWKRNDINDRVIENFINIILLEKDLICNTDKCLGTFISIDPDGNIFPCDRFGLNNFNNYNLFNIKNIKFGLSDFFESNVFSELVKNDISFINLNCKKCDVYYFCNGGCRANREINGNIKLNVKNENDCFFISEIINYIFNILFNLTEEQYLKLNHTIYNKLFNSNFIGKYVINKIAE